MPTQALYKVFVAATPSIYCLPELAAVENEKIKAFRAFI